MTHRHTFVLLAVATAIAAGASRPSAQSDLDAFMERVIARRDENWKKLQQYVLDERETFQLRRPGGARLYGFEREFTWFIREGYFIRSPLKADGVRVGESDRARFEREWMEREKRRDARQTERGGRTAVTIGSQGVSVDREGTSDFPADAPPERMGDVLTQTLEPRFVSAAYFLRFKFDPGHYALAGHERLADRDVLRIEYYPSKLFTEGRTRPNRHVRERDENVTGKMNKVSLVTLWIDPEQHQIIQYTFDNMDMDFLPGRSIVRVDDLRASMRMAEAFPGVWLPAAIDMQFGVTTAVGAIDGRYNVEYHNYRLAEVSTRIKG